MALRREKKRIGDMLINENVITQEQLEKALPIAKEKHKKIGETLIELGFTNELEIAKALSQQLGLELVNVSAINIPEEVQNLVSETVLRKHVMIPYAFDKNNANIVHVAMADPMDMVALDDFSIVTNLQVEPAVATGRDILLTLDKYYGDTEAMKAAQEYARERKEREQKNAEAEEATSKDVNNSPVVLLVNSIIEQAARLRASDIHIEALENKVRVRYRIDGALYEKAAYSIHLLSAIITRLKIIGGMDISEKRKPQDGRITMEIDKTEYDIRVSILPTVFGEKCVMRLAQKKALTRDKKELGFSDEELKAFDHILMNTNGIILVTGPTGSGKTYLVKTLARILQVPLAITDATTLTEAGYIGDDIESVVSKLLLAADNDVEKAEHGIIFIDEIDKIAKKKETRSRDVSGESVQQGMLKLLEGSEIEVPVGATSKNAMVPQVTVNTKDILFICGGAFPDLEDIIKTRLNKSSSMGFNADLKDKYDDEKNIMSYVTVDDLREYGMIPEFLGRLPIIYSLDRLDEDMLVNILKEPKNAILKQYQKLLELDEVKLEFTDDALRSIARKAMEKDTGARALRSIIEDFMLDIMYEIPKDSNIGSVTITEDVVEKKGAPVITMRA
mgnify:CR=1 FL=1